MKSKSNLSTYTLHFGLMNLHNATTGCLLGMAAGDALGLPFEGITRPRLERMQPDLNRYHFLFGRGMVSDDTEHAIMTAQALIESGGEPGRFAHALARRLRWWIAALPAGVGMATARAGARLWLGVKPERSGVFSAGNGPAMRAPILGVCFGGDIERLRALVHASTRLTHTDPRAEQGALAVALTAHAFASGAAMQPVSFARNLRDTLGSDAAELSALILKAAESAEDGLGAPAFALTRGLEKGVSGYMLHTVPAALNACFCSPHDFRAAVQSVIWCGGDTDTTAAIVGGVVGASVGMQGIPAAWRTNLAEWPRNAAWIESLGATLAESIGQERAATPPHTLPLLTLPRNLVFLGVVLAHGFRRLLPPYSPRSSA